jgi:tetratricopeptide (TPR) repeat protein
VRALSPCLLGLALLNPVASAAQTSRELMGLVFHDGEMEERVVEKNLIVTILETGNADETNDQGIFRIALPSIYNPGDTVTLVVEKSGWAIRYPLDGEVVIPRNSRDLIEIELLPLGSKLFWTHARIEKRLEYLIDTKRLGDRQQRAEADVGATESDIKIDFGLAIKEWAARYGFSAVQAKEEIDAWIAQVEGEYDNLHQLGLAHFARKEFEKAAHRFSEAGEYYSQQLKNLQQERKQLGERERRLVEKTVQSFSRVGFMELSEERFESALAAYNRAAGYLSRERFPVLWADTQTDLCFVQRLLGQRSVGVAAVEHLNEAVTRCENALSVEGLAPTARANIQTNLGSAYVEMAKHSPDLSLLTSAIQHFEAALAVYGQAPYPADWARVQNLRGIALKEQGIRVGGAIGESLFIEAQAAYQRALEVYTRDKFPEDWAIVQTNIGVLWKERGSRVGGQTGAQLLQQGADAQRKALEVYQSEHSPLEWAMAQNNLGNVLAQLGILLSGNAATEHLEEAVQALRKALEVYSRDLQPQAWAGAQNNLCFALQEQGVRTSGRAGAEAFSDAIIACRHALEVLTPEVFPELHFVVKRNLMSGLIAVGDLDDALTVTTQAPPGMVLFEGHEVLILLSLKALDTAAERLEQLIGIVDSAPDDFRTGWWVLAGPKYFVENEPELEDRRYLLVSLLNALQGGDRHSILIGLRAVAAELERLRLAQQGARLYQPSTVSPWGCFLNARSTALLGFTCGRSRGRPPA